MKRKMSAKSIEIRGQYISKWVSEGVAPATIEGWAKDAVKRELINVMAMIEAGDIKS